jgi:hypothetical protein
VLERLTGKQKSVLTCLLGTNSRRNLSNRTLTYAIEFDTIRRYGNQARVRRIGLPEAIFGPVASELFGVTSDTKRGQVRPPRFKVLSFGIRNTDSSPTRLITINGDIILVWRMLWDMQ